MQLDSVKRIITACLSTIIRLARPEGFEPPTLGLEVLSRVVSTALANDRTWHLTCTYWLALYLSVFRCLSFSRGPDAARALRVVFADGLFDYLPKV